MTVNKDWDRKLEANVRYILRVDDCSEKIAKESGNLYWNLRIKVEKEAGGKNFLGFTVWEILVDTPTNDWKWRIFFTALGIEDLAGKKTYEPEMLNDKKMIAKLREEIDDQSKDIRWRIDTDSCEPYAEETPAVSEEAPAEAPTTGPDKPGKEEEDIPF